ncbi:glucosamine-6-phosphate deaminase [Clostridium butyricum]|jgi:glucosamine-6-phosphate deaminase|uniref:Glucosamine-6-phosphate deaminase n=1 Tax=Clostridium butyricum TaxID=1492 RepID=A0A512TJU0_CLOBU|nr:glucosamine-6-phosphate deaminase [Clostridium butyricum]MBS5983462.1 glucosamine-6-phosphate deaminase [Clostridium butyricum]MDB2151886.1 glucosamine-6-phosphate deaminase [Clostridium butyricum]MDU4659128.1 glucosamine-6-phosphate deaminase [Clostridium butyricum]MDU4752785.1 glucosamine-6-phosphate deaminase [Clostridium butyricum]MDU5722467.1 glucosamine-6-phosphate deaminase [Clostridium butyricum]
MKIIVADNYNAMSRAAALTIKELINKKHDAVLGLATGSTPIGTYDELIKMNKNDEIDFSDIKTVNLDEYIGLNENNNQSYRYFMNEKLFNHININKKNTFVPNGTSDNIEEEAKNYDKMIDELGGIDLQILGIGNNGHVAFNEPDSSLSVGTHITNLTQNTIEANARFFESMDDVPKKAITMGLGQIMKAKKIILLANGVNKADAVKGLLSGKITTDNPATLLQLHRDVTLIIDKEIFNAIENINNYKPAI